MQSLRVCVITQQLRTVISGPGLYSNLLVASLLEQGHSVWVVAPESQRPASAPYTFIGVPEPKFGGSQARWVSLGASFWTALKQLVKTTPIDLFHFTDAREAVFCGALHPKIGNVNDTYSAELHPLGYYRQHYDDWLLRWAYYRAVHLAESAIYPGFERLVANSQFTARIIQSVYPLRAEKLRVCYKSVDVSRFRPMAQGRSYGGGAPTILFVGSNMQRKGLPSLIQAAPAVLRQFPAARFQVIGADARIAAMRQLCAASGVEAAFDFLGWKSQQELPDYYARADVFALPALTEALGVVFLEAMAAGVPVIGTRVGGIPEIIQHGENGLLVEPDNPTALAAALIQILGSPAEAARLAGSALNTLARFDKAAMMTTTYAIYAEVIDNDDVASAG